MRAMLDDKVPIKIMKRAISVQVENSLYNFEGALEQMGLLDVAEGKLIGSMDKKMRTALRWIGDDERMVSSIRTKLGLEAKGTGRSLRAHHHLLHRADGWRCSQRRDQVPRV